MKGRSSQSRMEQGNASTTLSLTSPTYLPVQSFATVESVVPSKNTTSKDKSNLCDSDTRTQKSSKTSAQDSISKEKDCKPY